MSRGSVKLWGMLDVSSAWRTDSLSVPLLVRVRLRSLAKLYDLTDSACYFRYRHARDGVGAHSPSRQKNMEGVAAFRVAMLQITRYLARLVVGLGLSMHVPPSRWKFLMLLLIN